MKTEFLSLCYLTLNNAHLLKSFERNISEIVFFELHASLEGSPRQLRCTKLAHML